MCMHEGRNKRGETKPWPYRATVRELGERGGIYADLWKNTCRTSLLREQYRFILAAGKE